MPSKGGVGARSSLCHRKLGKGKEMVDRLSNLVSIFDKPALDFRGNRAEGDDILGDAYEYLMRHFATESGKGKGQFYIPAEISRIMAKVIEMGNARNASQSIHDPICGSASLLLKAHDEARSRSGHDLTVYGQEVEITSAALARMNMILHDCPTAEIWKGDALLRSNNVQDAVVITDELQFVNAARVSPHQMLKNDDILICMANGSKALVGKAGLFRGNDGYEYTFGAFMGCFRTNSVEANPAFVFYLFQTGRYRDYINNLLAGSSINNLRPSSIESLEFSTPPLPQQTAIAGVLSDMDAELAALEQRRDKTRALKQGMMQELLTGRIRLVAP